MPVEAMALAVPKPLLVVLPLHRLHARFDHNFRRQTSRPLLRTNKWLLKTTAKNYALF